MDKNRDSLFAKIFHRYLVDAMSAMALGLFSSLIIGTIIAQLGSFAALEFLKPLAVVLQTREVYGAAIGAAIAWGLKADAMVIFSSAGAGAIGCAAGGPVGAFIAAAAGAEFGQLVSKRTPVDIVITPIVTIVSGGLAGQFTGPYIQSAMEWLGAIVNSSTQLMPLPMGMAVGVIVGMVLTLPISSAALCVMMGLGGLAGGAAAAGCAAQMIGFAVISFRDNGISGFISQGIGTSMLQMPNIARRPQIWIAPTIASAVCGALSAAVFRMTNIPAGAGMGTSGLVGCITAYGAMSPEVGPGAALTAIGVVHFLTPAVVALAADAVLRRIGLVKSGDMRLKSL